jgi:nicotinamide-nucleotide amidase
MQDLVETLSILLQAKKFTLTTAESCTGGLLAATITHRPGTSTMFERGFITYSNESKTEMLGVPKEVIEKYGAVSSETAQAMAQGALEHSKAQVAVSVTGIAGPDGGSEQKPVGLVYIGYAIKNEMAGSIEHRFTGNRKQVQMETTLSALKHLIRILGELK